MISVEFCLVVPVYQAEATVVDSLRSIVPQLYHSDQIVVLDDCSNDQSAILAEQYLQNNAPCPYQVICHQTKLGLPFLLNEGASLSRKQYVLRHDADDIALGNRVALQREVLGRHPSIDLLCGEKINFTIYPNVTSITKKRTTRCISNTVTPVQSISRVSLFYKNLIAHPTVAIKTELLLQFTYRTEFKTAEDYDLWLRILAANYKVAIINNPLIYYYSPPYSHHKIRLQLLYSIRARATNLIGLDFITIFAAFAGMLTDALSILKISLKGDQ